MTNPVIRTSPSQVLITMAAFVVVVAGMRAGADIIVPFLLALFIAVISSPALDWLERRGLPRGMAMIVVIAAIVTIGMGITGLVGSSLRQFTASLPEYTDRLNSYTQAVESWLDQRGVPFEAKELRDLIDASRVMKLAADIFNSFGGVLTNAFLIFLTVVFLLLETASFTVKLRAVADDHQAALSVGISLRTIWIIVWSVAGIVALVAGVMWGAKSGIQFSLSEIALKALPVLILGGFESIPGAIIGGLIIGMSEKLAEVFCGSMVGGAIENWFAVALALLFLLVRPQGLFGERIIERV